MALVEEACHWDLLFPKYHSKLRVSLLMQPTNLDVELLCISKHHVYLHAAMSPPMNNGLNLLNSKEAPIKCCFLIRVAEVIVSLNNTRTLIKICITFLVVYIFQNLLLPIFLQKECLVKEYTHFNSIFMI